MAYPSKPNDYLAKWREAERILAIREFTSTLPIPNNIISHPPEEADTPFPSRGYARPVPAGSSL